MGKRDERHFAVGAATDWRLGSLRMALTSTAPAEASARADSAGETRVEAAKARTDPGSTKILQSV
jgi:hypothetical protein